jgi:hypothetical protein
VADFFVGQFIVVGRGAVNQLKRGFRTNSKYIRVTTTGTNSTAILIYLSNKLLTQQCTETTAAQRGVRA